MDGRRRFLNGYCGYEGLDSGDYICFGMCFADEVDEPNVFDLINVLII